MARVFEMQNVPSVAEYVRVLTDLGARVTEEHRRLFRVHYQAEARTATAKELARLAGIPGGWTIVNLRYGKLGHAFCDELGIKPDLRPDDSSRWWSVWSRGSSTPSGFVWQMLPQVGEALEQLGWVGPARFISPDEVVFGPWLVEGAAYQVSVNAYERNIEARRQCIEQHGTNCCVCGFNFGEFYGSTADGYIHVHHLRPLSEVKGEYVVDPIEDLRPVCPNCHAVIHLGGGCRSVEVVRQSLKSGTMPYQSARPSGGT